MGSYDIFSAVKSRWETLWNIDVPTYYAGQDYQSAASSKSPWILLSVLDGEGSVASLKFAQEGGSKSSEVHPGIIALQVFVPLGEGQERARGLADLAAEIFRKVNFSNIQCSVPYHQVVGQEGNWWQHNVNCPYRFHEIT